MPRSGEIFWRAAASSKAPVDRLYFDTEPLTAGNWPFVSGQLRYCFALASAMKIELWCPEAALHERSEHWIREIVVSLSSIQGKAQSAQNSLRLVNLKASVEVPSRDEVRSKFTEVELNVIRHFNVRTAPYPQRALSEVFQMAVARGFTFEEKKDGVVGLQDCVILLSVLDHLAVAPAPSGFVSNDHIFFRQPDLAHPGANLSFIRGLEALEKLLRDAMDETYKAEFSRWWDEMTNRITATLEAQRESVQSFIQQSISDNEVAKLFSGTAVYVEPPTVDRFSTIRPVMEGAATDPLAFSCDVDTIYTATLEQPMGVVPFLGNYLWAQPDDPVSGRIYASPQFNSPVSDRRSRSATVELNAVVDADYSNLKLLEAHIRT